MLIFTEKKTIKKNNEGYRNISPRNLGIHYMLKFPFMTLLISAFLILLFFIFSCALNPSVAYIRFENLGTGEEVEKISVKRGGFDERVYWEDHTAGIDETSAGDYIGNWPMKYGDYIIVELAAGWYDEIGFKVGNIEIELEDLRFMDDEGDALIYHGNNRLVHHRLSNWNTATNLSVNVIITSNSCKYTNQGYDDIRYTSFSAITSVSYTIETIPDATTTMDNIILFDSNKKWITNSNLISNMERINFTCVSSGKYYVRTHLSDTHYSDEDYYSHDYTVTIRRY